jgi:hypothetical protein
MNTRLLLLAYFFFSQSFAFGQTIITGKILDEKGIALPGANVFIKGSFDGTSSDTSGAFSFESSESGDQLLVVSMMGFKSQELPITLSESQLEIAPINLIEEFNEMNTVTISAGAMEASDEKKSVILRPLDI